MTAKLLDIEAVPDVAQIAWILVEMISTDLDFP
jgi:hypothetical protein